MVAQQCGHLSQHLIVHLTGTSLEPYGLATLYLPGGGSRLVVRKSKYFIRTIKLLQVSYQMFTGNHVALQ